MRKRRLREKIERVLCEREGESEDTHIKWEIHRESGNTEGGDTYTERERERGVTEREGDTDREEGYRAREEIQSEGRDRE